MNIKTRLSKLEETVSLPSGDVALTAWIATQDESEPEKFSVTKSGASIGMMTRAEVCEQMTGPGIIIGRSEQRRDNEH